MVLELVVTPIDLVGGVVVVVDFEVEELRERAPPLRRTPSKVKPPDDTWVTFPEAKAKLRKFLAPDGREPLVGNVLPLGRVPPFGGLKPPPPPKPPRAPVPDVVQLPLESGWVTVTLEAVTGPLVAPLEAGVPVTVTQSPTVTADTDAVSVWVKVVVEVQLTVTWPLWEFWTSIDVPVIDATVPDAVGIVGLVDGAEVEGLAAASLAEEVELQATASKDSAPRSNRRPARQACRVSRCRPL
ncbi:MAG: hypothetical protein ABSH04_05700 [Acidimicrobiales bacterium]